MLASVVPQKLSEFLATRQSIILCVDHALIKRPCQMSIVCPYKLSSQLQVLGQS